MRGDRLSEGYVLGDVVADGFSLGERRWYGTASARGRSMDRGRRHWYGPLSARVDQKPVDFIIGTAHWRLGQIDGSWMLPLVWPIVGLGRSMTCGRRCWYSLLSAWADQRFVDVVVGTAHHWLGQIDSLWKRLQTWWMEWTLPVK